VKIWLDVDGVQADFTWDFLQYLSIETGRVLTHADVTGWDFDWVLGTPAELAQVWRHFEKDGAVRYMPDLTGALAGVAALRKAGHWVGALTAPRHGREWYHGRVQWLLDRGFDRKEIILTADKTHVHGDLLVEDHHVYLNDWLDANPTAHGILLDQPWNRGKRLHPQATRVQDWREIVQIVDYLTLPAPLHHPDCWGFPCEGC
jgi:5'(3')-deoxyribonucleotidase